MRKATQILATVFMILGICCMVAILFGATHQWFFTYVSFIMAGALHADSKENIESTKEV